MDGLTRAPGEVEQRGALGLRCGDRLACGPPNRREVVHEEGKELGVLRRRRDVAGRLPLGNAVGDSPVRHREIRPQLLGERAVVQGCPVEVDQLVDLFALGKRQFVEPLGPGDAVEQQKLFERLFDSLFESARAVEPVAEPVLSDDTGCGPRNELRTEVERERGDGVDELPLGRHFDMDACSRRLHPVGNLEFVAKLDFGWVATQRRVGALR